MLLFSHLLRAHFNPTVSKLVTYQHKGMPGDIPADDIITWELLYIKAQKYEPKFSTFSDENKFKFIIQTKEKKLLQAFGIFLYTSYPDK